MVQMVNGGPADIAGMARVVLPANVIEAREAAKEILLQNLKGESGLPRTAGWGYPEPYTRDMMLSSLGFLVSKDWRLIEADRMVLEELAKTQTVDGHIMSLANDPMSGGASDTTPLFLLGLALYRQASGDAFFLEGAANKALSWMRHQSPSNQTLIGQLPLTDWRDEQYVMGFGLYVNALVYGYLCHFESSSTRQQFSADLRKTLAVADKPYYALYLFKRYQSDRFDLLGNALAVIFGLMPKTQAREMIGWIEDECRKMKVTGDLAVDLAPNLFPFILKDDKDWLTDYAEYNPTGCYHNGGIWPFVSALHIVAILAVGKRELALEKLLALTDLVKLGRDSTLEWGFHEWVPAQTGKPTERGNDWQTWSAALYLYAVACYEENKVLLLRP